MTREEQFKKIVDQIGPSASQFQPIHLSILVLTSYMDELFNHGLLFEKPISINPSGLEALEICKKEKWHPSDTDIVAFCKELIPPEQVEQFVIVLRAIRDDKDAYFAKAKTQAKF